jgi:hypothetical protein
MQQRRTAGGFNGLKAMLIRLNTPTMVCGREVHRTSKEANAVDRAVVCAGSVVTRPGWTHGTWLDRPVVMGPRFGPRERW